ncbi:hypothetical protein SGPA1_21340 [Streptomyces misionensis JCM 4497]
MPSWPPSAPPGPGVRPSGRPTGGSVWHVRVKSVTLSAVAAPVPAGRDRLPGTAPDHGRPGAPRRPDGHRAGRNPGRRKGVACETDPPQGRGHRRAHRRRPGRLLPPRRPRRRPPGRRARGLHGGPGGHRRRLRERRFGVDRVPVHRDHQPHRADRPRRQRLRLAGRHRQDSYRQPRPECHHPRRLRHRDAQLLAAHRHRRDDLRHRVRQADREDRRHHPGQLVQPGQEHRLCAQVLRRVVLRRADGGPVLHRHRGLQPPDQLRPGRHRPRHLRRHRTPGHRPHPHPGGPLVHREPEQRHQRHRLDRARERDVHQRLRHRAERGLPAAVGQLPRHLRRDADQGHQCHRRHRRRSLRGLHRPEDHPARPARPGPERHDRFGPRHHRAQRRRPLRPRRRLQLHRQRAARPRRPRRGGLAPGPVHGQR